MKNKGFTLIELLAVIVILAIIALIAVPIVLNIIKDTKESATLRSAELYLDAVNLAIAKASLYPNFSTVDITCTIYGDNEDIPNDYDKDDLECNNISVRVDVSGEVPVKGIIKFNNGKMVKSNTWLKMEDGLIYSYSGNELVKSTGYKPKYYSLNNSSSMYGTVGGNLPNDIKTDPSKLANNPNFYLGLDSEDGTTVSFAYVCFIKNNLEYCLRGFDLLEHDRNISILENAYGSSNISCNSSECYVESDGFNVIVGTNGQVETPTGAGGCIVTNEGYFNCS